MVLAHFKKLLAEAKLPDMTVHQMRHGVASLLAGAGLHPKIAQGYMRHASSKTTLDEYTHTTDAQVSEAADTMQRLMVG